MNKLKITIMQCLGHICNKPFVNRTNNKIRDRNHLTGELRGAWHYECNLRICYPKLIPVVMHNFTNWDCHLFVTKFGKHNGRLSFNPENSEKYINIAQSFKVDNYLKDRSTIPIVRELRFIDSFGFLQTSLYALRKTIDR